LSFSKTMLSKMALEYIDSQQKVKRYVEHYESKTGVILFPQSGDNKDAMYYGNFQQNSLEVILADASYKGRLKKVHSRRSGFPSPHNKTACELDSCNSSDALLMNIFCYPKIRDRINIGIDVQNLTIQGEDIHFGIPIRLFKRNNQSEISPTEIDMVIGDTIVEAKLSETDFQPLNKTLFDSYESFFNLVEERMIIDQSNQFLPIYQLLRNATIRRMLNCKMVVIIDDRKANLKKYYRSFVGALKQREDRDKIFMVTWQDLVKTIEIADLKSFLKIKYGIE